MRLRRTLLGATLLAATAVLQAQQQPVFRTAVNYVEVDAVVTDADGHFVPGLTADDFQVREQRQLQQIATFTYIDLPIGPAAASTTPSPVRFRPDLAPAERVDADRIYLIYLNGASRPLIRHRATDFVRDYMQPRDIAAVWDAEAPGKTIEFTSDKDALLNTIDASRDARGAPAADRGGVEGRRLREAIDWLSAMQGRRKSLLLFTEGWTLPPTGERERAKRDRDVTEWLQGRRPGPMVEGTLLNPTDITGQSDVHIYSYDVRGLVAPVPGSAITGVKGLDPGDMIAAPYRNLADNVAVLRSISEQTGGRAFVESNDYRLGFTRIVEDNSKYYILGYASSNGKPDGLFRTLDVRVTRPGVTVRARDGYVAR